MTIQNWHITIRQKTNTRVSSLGTITKWKLGIWPWREEMCLKLKHDKKYCYYLTLNTMNWIIRNNASTVYVAPSRRAKHPHLSMSPYLSSTSLWGRQWLIIIIPILWYGETEAQRSSVIAWGHIVKSMMGQGPQPCALVSKTSNSL